MAGNLLHETPSRHSSGWTAAAFLALATAYATLAAIGLNWATVDGIASPVWPAAGVALAGLLLGGLRLWPAVLLGSFLAFELSASRHSMGTHLLLASGNALAAVAGTYLLRRFAQFDPQLNRTRDILALIAVGAGGSTAVAAAVGAAVLGATVPLSAREAGSVWFAWWVGDATGVLTTTSLVLAWAAAPFPRSPRYWAHLIACLAVTVAVGWAVFVNTAVGLPNAWYAFVPLVWAALACQVRGAAAAVGVVATLAVWGTTANLGPFADADLAATRVVYLQEFIAIAAATALLLAVVADERRAAEALQAATAEAERHRGLLKAIADNASVALFIVDDRQQCVFMNPAAEWMTGFTLDEVRGRPLHDAIHHTRPDGTPYPLAECPIDRAFPEHHREQGEEVFVHRDGHFYPVAFTASPIREGGVVRGTVIEVTDITDRKRAEQALRASEERFRRAFIASSVGMALVSPGGTVLQVNPAFCQMLEYTEAELLTLGVQALTHPDDHAADQAQAERLLAGETDSYRLERRYRHKDGRTVWGMLSVALVRGDRGEPLHFVAQVQDITDRRQAEEALREGERRLATLLANLPGMAYRCPTEPPWPLTFASEGVLGLTGRPAGDFLDQRVSWLDIIHPDDVDGVGREVEAALREGRMFSMVYRIRHASGEVRWVLDRGRPVSDESGVPVAREGFVGDLTDQKRAEEQLRRNHETFYHLIQNDPFGVYVVDADFRLAQVSAGSRKVFQNVRPLIGRDFAEVLRTIWAEPFANEAIARFRHTLATGEPYAAQNTVERRQDIHEVEAYDWKIERVTLPDGRYGVVCYFYDLSERQRWEAALRQSEERTRTVLESITEAFVAVDADWRFTYLNAEAERVYGMRREDVLGKSLWEVFPEARGTVFEREYRRAMADRVRGRVDAPFDRLRAWFEVNVFPVEDGGLSFYFRDVTDRKRAEEERAAALATLRGLVTSAPIGVAVFDTGMRYTLVNQPLADMNGLPVEDHLGKAVAEVVPGLLPTVEPWFRQVIETGRPVVEHLVEGETPKAPGVKRAWVESWFPVVGADGTTVGVGAVVQEVTEKRRAEEELRLAEERFQLALRRAPVNLFNQDRDLRYTWVHNVEPSLTVEDTIGRTDAELLGPEDARTLSDVKGRVLRTGRGERCEVTIHPGGTARHYDLTVEPITDAGGAVTGVACAALDITGLKEAEAALREADRRKDEFLATLAHELRNPLAPLRNGLEILRLAGDTTGAVTRARDMMDRQLGHLVRLVDDLLDISRVSQGKITLRRERVAVREAVDAAVEACRPAIDAKQHVLDIDLPAEPLAVDGDRTRLTQIIANLLSNAAKYTEPGGRIRIAARQEDGEAVIQVTDTGVGIPPELVPIVWDMFTQVRDTLDKAQGGLGIGLSLVKKLVDLHGGTVRADSAGPGQGSTFTVRLPLAADVGQPVGHPAAPVRATTGGQGRRVLVVDDNVDAAESLALMLRLRGYTATTAHSGPEAVTAAKAFQPEVVFLDIGLPGMSGYEVARRLRADPGLSGAVLVALTGWGSEDDKRQAQEAGFDIHLTKPVEPAAVESLFSRFTSPETAGPDPGQQFVSSR